MGNRLLYVGLDVGGTTMKACVVDETGQAYPSISMATEAYKGQDHGLETMAESIRRAVSEAGKTMSEIAGIGVATPGPMDISGGIILEPANLKPWKNVPVRKYIQEAFGLPTAYQNDANAAALGEFWVGAGKEAKSLVLFTLGTGIGGGIILHNRVLEGEHSHGAEIGHMKVEMTKPRLCGCGHWGCLESYASATSVVKRTKEALESDGGKSILHTIWQGGDQEITSRDIFDAAKNGDELAQKIVDETSFYLAVGAMNLMHIIDPEIVAFGGGMVAAGPDFLQKIQHYVKELALPVPAEKTIIRYAMLGSDAGMIGSAAGARMLTNNGKL